METYEFHQYCNLLPDMQEGEFDELKDDIKKNGLLNPIVLFENFILDGKHRYRACLESNINPIFTDFSGDKQKALSFVISQNIRRRNLDPSQRSVIGIRIKKELADLAAERQKEAGKLGSEFGKLGGRGIDKGTEEYRDKKREMEEGKPLRQFFAQGVFDTNKTKKAQDNKSSEQAAKIVGTNRQYIQDAEKIEKQAPELLKPILDGKINIQDAKKMLKLNNHVKEKLIDKINGSENINVKKAITEINKEIKGKTVLQEIKKDIAEKLNIRHCSMQELLSDKTLKIDAIITDPPYVKESLHLFEELAKLSKDIPLVAVMTGQYHLPEIMESMCKHLKYRWTFAYLTPGRTNQQHQKKINTAWKPVIIFGESAEWIPIDVVTSNTEDKEFHIWGQSISGFTELIERITSPGQIICDPFVGGGTTAVACLKTGRRFVGGDIDENHVKTAVERCNQEII